MDYNVLQLDKTQDSDHDGKTIHANSLSNTVQDFLWEHNRQDAVMLYDCAMRRWLRKIFFSLSLLVT